MFVVYGDEQARIGFLQDVARQQVSQNKLNVFVRQGPIMLYQAPYNMLRTAQFEKFQQALFDTLGWLPERPFLSSGYQSRMSGVVFVHLDSNFGLILSDFDKDYLRGEKQLFINVGDMRQLGELTALQQSIVQRNSTYFDTPSVTGERLERSISSFSQNWFGADQGYDLHSLASIMADAQSLYLGRYYRLGLMGEPPIRALTYVPIKCEHHGNSYTYEVHGQKFARSYGG